jgi:hypothetical protein
MDNMNIKTREDLKAISKQIKPMIQAAGFNTVNEALKHLYEIPESMELNTFNGWKEKGLSVKKGEHAFTFWSAPISKKAKQSEAAEEAQTAADDKGGHFAICKLFAACQVEAR